MWEILTHPSHRRRTSREWSWLDLTYIGGLTLNWIESDTILKMDLAYVNPKESSRLKNYQSILTIFLNNVRYFNNLGIDLIKLSLIHLIELSHLTSFILTMIICFALIWLIGLMLLNLNCILFLFYFSISIFVFSHFFTIAYKLFDEIPPCYL